MRILITGADGFVGKNLALHLATRPDTECVTFTRENNIDQLPEMLNSVDWVFHLAGSNRPADPSEFYLVNRDLTAALCEAIKVTGRTLPIVYTSSIQATLDNTYGESKLAGEQLLIELHTCYKVPVYIYRLPNIFGKWARPNYNSAVATFCHNIAREIPIDIHDPEAKMRLLYIDDLISCFEELLSGYLPESIFATASPEYSISVGDLAEQIRGFKASRQNLLIGEVGQGLQRALYATYLSYLPPESFDYTVPRYSDARGVFVEMLKTPTAGQFSFFTAHPGITRGGHYHHSKTEKFLVIQGRACFRFKRMDTGEVYELTTSDNESKVVETAPGWTHDVTNIGDTELICMLWANELFDPERPDTYYCPLDKE